MKIGSRQTVLSAAVLAALTALPVAPVALAQDGVLDASVNWEFNDWQFSFFGRNLTDEDGYTHGYDVAGLWSYSAVRPPRTYGLEAIYRFGD